MPDTESAQLRRQIGFQKRQIRHHISSLIDTLKEYNVEPTKPNFSHFDEDTLESFRFEISSAKRALMKAYTSITKLHDRWFLLQESDTNEKKIFEDYIQKYGDFRETISAAVNRMEQCDELLNALDEEYALQNLNPPSDSSDTSLEDNDNQWRARTRREAVTSNPSPTSPDYHYFRSAPNPTTDSAFLNFVDASILTEMELPTFDGNLLDYPEFKSRFFTLVGNKTQLNETTKFSLLKSYLRGKALQSIQDLSLTEENYYIARDILKTLFDDEITLEHILCTKLAQLPSCDEDGRHLATLYNQMFSLVRQFSKGKDDSTETALGALLLNKLPFRVRSQIYDRTAHSHNVSPSELLNLLTDIVRKDSSLFEMEYHLRPQRLHLSRLLCYVKVNPTTSQISEEEQKQRMPLLSLYSTFLHRMYCILSSQAKERTSQATRKHHSSLCFNRGQSTDKLRAATSTSTRLRSTSKFSNSRRTHNNVQETQAHFVETFADSAAVKDLNPQVKPETNSTTTFTCSMDPALEEKQTAMHCDVARQATLMCTLVSLFNPSEPSKQLRVTLTTQENNCVSSNGKENCAFNELTVMTLQPLQQETCLTLRNNRNQAIALVSIRVDGIKFRCNQNVEFFTRDHDLIAESIHRCYLAGSCTQDACDRTTAKDQLKEFSNLANSSPGYTFCEKSCGCLTCDGCFFCSPSCLFYRIFAVPKTKGIYQVFKCPSRELVVDALVSIQDNESTYTTKSRLSPGKSVGWRNLRFSFIGTIVPQLPILSSTFMKTQNKISIIKETLEGQMTAQSAGQLQCSSIEEAKDFRCHFSSSVCKCTHGLRSVSCICPQVDMSNLMNAAPLPQISKNFIIFSEQNTVYAKASVGSALQPHVVAENLKITSRFSNSTCIVETSDLTGCYNCLTGAEISISCQSSQGEITATVACPNQLQIWRCGTNGHLNKVRLYFDTSFVSLSCLISCPGGSTNITVKGSLQFLNDGLLTEK